MATTDHSFLSLYHLAPPDMRTARRIAADVLACYQGKDGRFLPCAAPYSNLEHVLATALAAGRIVDGCHKSGEIAIPSSTALAVLAAALLHDIGFLRRPEERDTPEGAFTFRHVERGQRFAGAYLAAIGCDASVVRAVHSAITATALYREVQPATASRPADMHVAAIVAAADVLAQAAVDDILQAMGRLWSELEAAYATEDEERIATIDAPRFRSFHDLLLNILEFYDTALAPRLEDPAGFYRFLPFHFGTEEHPYRTAIRRNYETLLQSRSLLLGVTEHLFAARSLRDLATDGLPHLRRLLQASALALCTGRQVLADAPVHSGIIQTLRDPAVQAFLASIEEPVFIRTVEEMDRLDEPLPPSLARALYPILLRAGTGIRPLANGTAWAALFLVSPDNDRAALDASATLLADLGPGILQALRNAEERSRALPARERLKDLFLGHGMAPDLVEHLLAESARAGQPFPLLLAEREGIDAEAAFRLAAEAAGLPFRRLDPGMAEGLDAMPSVSIRYLKRHHVAPVAIRSDGTVEAAVADPLHEEPAATMHRLFRDQRLQLFVAPAADIFAFLDQVFGPAGSSPGQLLRPAEIESFIPAGSTDPDDERQASPDDHLVIRLAEKILRDAVIHGASDIHIEYLPLARRGRVRMRQDGILHHHLDLHPGLLRSLVTRYKVLARMDITAKRLPQDGRIRLRSRNQPVEVRVATIPRGDGFEEMVLRVLQRQRPPSLDDLHLTPANRQALDAVLAATNGLFVVAGATGAGKTTTIHAALTRLNREGIKIWTAEDPVEIRQDGVSQVQVQPGRGLGFPQALKAFLRADPDVIFVGEMRDQETAATAVRAALTGHLVLSTLHTSGAVQALLRLDHLGISGFDLAEALRGILAQRLVRRLCDRCSRPGRLTAEEKKRLARAHRIPARVRRPGRRGCDACWQRGFRGRIPLHELLTPTTELAGPIRRLDIPGLQQVLARDKWPAMLDDGVAKVEQGLVCLAEVLAGP